MLKDKEMKTMQMSLVDAITNLTNAMSLTFATIRGNVDVTAIHAQQQPFNNMLKLDFIQNFNPR
jgi:hypothetical protein